MQPVILKKHRVSESADPVRLDAHDASRVAAVRLVKDGGADVRGLEIVCACGERIVVELEYEPAAAPGRPDGGVR